VSVNNPFQYEAANNLSEEMIAEFYVEDFNFSRVIQSKRNIFLVGERGSGKTMTLLYNSLRVQLAKHKKQEKAHPLHLAGLTYPLYIR
jgi:predicted NACHT family NTPase